MSSVMKFLRRKSARTNTGFSETMFTSTPTVPATPAVYDPKARPANFDSPNYRPGGQARVQFINSLLGEINTLFLFDDSGSMAGANWALCRQVLPVIVDAIMQNDDDGIDWYWLNYLTDATGSPEDGLAGTGYNNIQNPDYVLELFDQRPEPAMTHLTYTGRRLAMILDCYITLCEKRHRAGEELPKSLSIVVFTDGGANDQDFLKQTIIKSVKRLDAIEAPERQCAIQFLQIFDPACLERGTYRERQEWRVALESIAEHLRVLDDDIKKLANSERDMVDTKKLNDIIAAGGFNAESLLNVLCGALISRLDNKKSAVGSN